MQTEQTLYDFKYTFPFQYSTHLEGHLNHGYIPQQYLEAQHQLVAIIASVLDEFVEQCNRHGAAAIGWQR